jgi:hypothetical protein
LHEDQDLGPPRPEPAQAHPEPAVDGGDAGTPFAMGEHGELLPQGEVLEHEVGAAAEGRPQRAEEQRDEAEHDEVMVRASAKNVNSSHRARVLARYSRQCDEGHD